MPLTPAQALSRIMDSRVADARVRSARTLANLLALGRVKPYSKRSIDWDVRVGGEAASIEAVTVNSANTATGDSVPANLSIGNYRVIHQFNISRIDIAEAATVAPGELNNLFAAQLDDALNVIFRRVNNLIFTGDGTAASAAVIGFNKVLDNTAAYAGIDPATYAAWKAIVDTNATARPITKPLIRRMDKLCMVNDESYDLVVMNPDTAESYANQFDSQAGAGVFGTVPANGAGLKNADLGHGDTTFNGRTIVQDPACPVGDIVLLDSSQLDLFIYAPSLGNPNNGGVGEQAVNTAYGMPIIISELASLNPDQRTFAFRVHPQLRLFNRRSLKAIRNIQ